MPSVREWGRGETLSAPLPPLSRCSPFPSGENNERGNVFKLRSTAAATPPLSDKKAVSPFLDTPFLPPSHLLISSHPLPSSKATITKELKSCGILWKMTGSHPARQPSLPLFQLFSRFAGVHFRRSMHSSWLHSQILAINFSSRHSEVSIIWPAN